MHILLIENHVVVAAASVAEAKKRLSEHGSFGVFLVDYDLDDGKGAEVVRFIREQEFDGVVIGTSARERGNAALVEAGVDGVCPKASFRNIEQVIDRIRLRLPEKHPES